MRARRADACPRCGSRMGVVDGSQRTVPGGLWYEVRCPNCGHRADAWRARRGKGYNGTDAPTGAGGA